MLKPPTRADATEFGRSLNLSDLIFTSCSNTTIAGLERDNLTSGQTEALSHCTNHQS